MKPVFRRLIETVESREAQQFDAEMREWSMLILRRACPLDWRDDGIMQPDALESCEYNGTQYSRCFDWRKHVPESISVMWSDLNERERRIVAIMGDRIANLVEEWD